MDIGEIDYRQGGRERLEEAKVLLKDERFAGGAYLAGRAVESLLRAVIWHFDSEIRAGRKTLDTGHDLRELFDLILALGALTNERQRAELRWKIQSIYRLWSNNLRYIPTRKLKSIWWRAGAVHKRQTLKQAASGYYQTCSAVVERCEALCES